MAGRCGRGLSIILVACGPSGGPGWPGRLVSWSLLSAGSFGALRGCCPRRLDILSRAVRRGGVRVWSCVVLSFWRSAAGGLGRRTPCLPRRTSVRGLLVFKRRSGVDRLWGPSGDCATLIDCGLFFPWNCPWGLHSSKLKWGYSVSNCCVSPVLDGRGVPQW